jgi:DNA-binding transcriptional MerR regulator
MPCKKRPDKELLRIGDLASATGTTLRTLHYYEELGLIRPATRTPGGFRLYEPRQLERLQLVQELRALGLELTQIKELFAAHEAEDGGGGGSMRHAVEKELRRVKSLVYRLTRLRNDLDATLDILKDCENRACPRAPGGSYCPECEVLRDRPYVPSTFLQTSTGN